MDLFYSTRGKSEGVSGPQAVLRGIAPDGGLYIRNEFPRVEAGEFLNADFRTISKRVMGAYLSGYTQDEIDRCVDQAYENKFEAEEITPLKQIGDRYVLELYHGPTAAFKDVALSALPRLMRCAMEKEKRTDEIFILTATSGDTGSAALTGFCDVEGIRILVFFPDKGISPIQRAQMTSMKGGNVGVCAISGNFDDAQTGVKRIFTELDGDYLRKLNISLSSANSINIGRLVPQIVYFYSAYLDLVRAGRIAMGEDADFCVPTGNFGDILAGWIAKKMGLPIGRLICASNSNNVLTDFLNTGVYDKNRPFMVTTSPSMDILVSSNLERLLYFAADRDAEKVCALMDDLKKTGKYTVDQAMLDYIREDFEAGCATDEQAAQAIREVMETFGYLMDPHTAVAWKCAGDYIAKNGGKTPCVVLSTASAFKFPESVLKALGEAAPKDAQAQLERMEQVAGKSAPKALRDAILREVRFRDVVAPENMMNYVRERMAGK